MRLKTAGGVFIFTLAGLAIAIPVPQAAIEHVYSSGLYPVIQRALTTFSNLAPFALLDVLIVGLPILWLALIGRDLRSGDTRGRVVRRWIVRTATAAAVLYLCFLAAWGLNYRRVPLDHRLPYDAKAVTAEATREVAQLSVSRVNALYEAAHSAGFGAGADVDPSLAGALAMATRELGVAGTVVPARPKRTILNLYFRPAAVAGMTDPFFLETLVESDLLPVERPFVIAHEWGHLAGFADEGEANFAGWLTCMHGGVSAQYSGWLFLFGEMMNGVPRADRAKVIAPLAAGPRADLRAIAARLTRDVTPQVASAGWRVYDQYLKANRVEAGAASYAQVVRLVLGTRIGLNVPAAASPAR